MNDYTNLIAASAAFVGSHLLLSHPLRQPLAARLGTAAFQAVYSLAAAATLLWTVLAWRDAPDAVVYHGSDTVWIIATVVMWIASVLLAGSFVGNPALPSPGAKAAATAEPRGVFAITRHPMMWSFALWALVHAAIAPSGRNHILMTAIIILALAGSFGQDRKKERLMGDRWHRWRRKTAFVPFAGQIFGRLSWSAAIPSVAILVTGTLLWLVATWGHGLFDIPAAGIWRWLA